MGNTDEILKIQKRYVTVDDVMHEMDIDDAADALGKPTPTVLTADALKITVPSREEKPIDQDTGLPRKVASENPYATAEPVELTKD